MKKIIVLIGENLKHSEKILQACADALGKVTVEDKDIIDGLIINDNSNHVFDVTYLNTSIEDISSAIGMIKEAGKIVMLAFDRNIPEGTRERIRRLLGYPVSWAMVGENSKFLSKDSKAVEHAGSIALAFYFLHVENIEAPKPTEEPISFF